MAASRYEWEMFYLEPDIDFTLVEQKLKEKKWDGIMVGSKYSSVRDDLSRGALWCGEELGRIREESELDDVLESFVFC